MASSSQVPSSKRPRTKIPTHGPSRTRTSSRIPPPPPFDATRFLDLDAQTLFERKICRAKILTGRTVDFADMAARHHDIRPQFDAIHLSTLCALDVPINQEVVRLFYANLSITSDSSIKSFVRGVHIHLSHTLIAEVLACPNDGDAYFTSYFWNHPVIPHRDALSLIGHSGKANRQGKITNASLDASIRLLHRIIAYTILPRTGHFDELTLLDTFLLYCLISGTQPHIPLLISRVAHSWSTRPRAILPFGPLLSHILLDYLAVPSEPADTYLPMPREKFGSRTLVTMHLAPARRTADEPIHIDDSESSQESEDSSDDDATEDFHISPRPSARQATPPPPPYDEALLSQISTLMDTKLAAHQQKMEAYFNSKFTDLRNLLRRKGGQSSPPAATTPTPAVVPDSESEDF